MSIKPVLVPDHTADDLRRLMDHFAEAATGPATRQLNEMDYGGGRSPHAGMGLPRDDDDDAGKKEIIVKPEAAKKTFKDVGDILDREFSRAHDDKGVAEGTESENLAIGQQMARDGIEYDPAQEGEIISQIGDYLKRSGMTPRQIRGYMIDNDFVSDQLSYLPRKSELAEFAPSMDGGDDGDDDGFDEDTLKRLAAQWYNGDEDPRIEQVLMAAGWEIGQDEGYEDEPGVFVVMSGDEHGKTYMSWPAEELRSEVNEVDLSGPVVSGPPLKVGDWVKGKIGIGQYEGKLGQIEEIEGNEALVWMKSYATTVKLPLKWLSKVGGSKFAESAQDVVEDGIAESQDPVAELKRLLK